MDSCTCSPYPSRSAPNGSNRLAFHQFRNFREILVTVVDQGNVRNPGNEKIGQQSVEVIGIEKIFPPGQQQEKESKVVFGIKGESPFKDQVHSPDGIRSFQVPAVFSESSDQKDLISCLVHRFAGSRHPLIALQIVDRRYDHSFGQGIQKGQEPYGFMRVSVACKDIKYYICPSAFDKGPTIHTNKIITRDYECKHPRK